jgi:transposase-like protein
MFFINGGFNYGYIHLCQEERYQIPRLRSGGFQPARSVRKYSVPRQRSAASVDAMMTVRATIKPNQLIGRVQTPA